LYESEEEMEDVVNEDMFEKEIDMYINRLRSIEII
jgi:hypothetical protein